MMDFKMKKTIFAVITLVFIGSSLSVFAHSGGTDKYGCHHKTADGTYHCHKKK